MTKETAMKILKELHDKSLFAERTAIETIIPELKESENEKIRKALLEMVHDTTGDELWVDYNVHKEDALAWLEMQGTNIDINPSEFEMQLNKLLKQFESLPKEDILSSLSFYLNVIQNDGTYKAEEKQGEQKPVGKPKLKFKVGDMVCKKKDNSFCATINSITDTVYLCNVFDSDGDYDDDYAFLISEQDEYELVEKIKPQFAWSDEDEENLQHCCMAISADSLHTYEDKQEMEAWLKSLKDRIGG